MTWAYYVVHPTEYIFADSSEPRLRDENLRGFLIDGGSGTAPGLNGRCITAEVLERAMFALASQRCTWCSMSPM